MRGKWSWGYGFLGGLLLSVFALPFLAGDSDSRAWSFLSVAGVSILMGWAMSSRDGPIRPDPGDSTLVLVDPGRRVVDVVAAFQKLTGLEYVEVGDLLQDWPTPVLTAVSDQVAERAQHALESAGATVLIETHVSA